MCVTNPTTVNFPYNERNLKYLCSCEKLYKAVNRLGGCLSTLESNSWNVFSLHQKSSKTVLLQLFFWVLASQSDVLVFSCSFTAHTGRKNRPSDASARPKPKLIARKPTNTQATSPESSPSRENHLPEKESKNAASNSLPSSGLPRNVNVPGAVCAHCGINFRIEIPAKLKTVQCPVPTCRGLNQIVPIGSNRVRVDMITGKHSVCFLVVWCSLCVFMWPTSGWMTELITDGYWWLRTARVVKHQCTRTNFSLWVFRCWKISCRLVAQILMLRKSLSNETNIVRILGWWRRGWCRSGGNCQWVIDHSAVEILMCVCW